MLKSLLLATAALTASFSSVWADSYKLGDTIPATTSFTDQHGKSHTLQEFRGKTLVMEWVNYGCPFTRKHYDSNNMQTLQEKTVASGVNWLGVISSAPGKQGHLTPDNATAAIAKQGFKGTLMALDETGTLGKAFGAETTPHMFILNAEGKLVYMGAIDNIPSFNADDIAKSTNYVSQALAEIKAGKPVSTPQTKSYGCSVKY